MNTTDNIKYLGEINTLAQTYLNLGKWGFTKRENIVEGFPAIAYQSQWCLVKLSWAGAEIQGAYTLNIDYARLHAPLNNLYMISNGEKCRCWHNIAYALHFLNGSTPESIAGNNYKRPQIINEFIKSDIGQKLSGPLHQPEWITRLHNTIWDYYGESLFELFDSRKPKLWNAYRQFIKEIYDIQGRKPNIQPPLDNIC